MEDRCRRCRQGEGATRHRRHDHQPHHRQRRGRDRVGEPVRAGLGPRHGDGPPAQERCNGVRRRAEQAGEPGMGRLGQRHRGARTGHARHVPGGGLLPPRGQHPADPGRGANAGQVGRGPDPRPGNGLRNPDRPGARHMPARAQDRPHRASLPGPGCRHRHAARPEDRCDLPGGAAGRACQLHHPAVPQG